MDFQIKFHRYNPKTTCSRLSATWFTKAEDIRGALANAELFIAGMREGGCEDRVIVASIETRGLRGDECVDSLTIWDTQEERDARFAKIDEATTA